MSELRICPICENDIPADTRFLCPHCKFDLKWLDDEDYIVEKRKKHIKISKRFGGKKYIPENRKNIYKSMLVFFDIEDTIAAPINLVWQEAYKNARQGGDSGISLKSKRKKIKIEKVENLLVSIDYDGYGHVYLMVENPDGTTYFRHVIDYIDDVMEALDSDPDPWEALDALFEITDTLARKINYALRGVYSIFVALGFGGWSGGIRELGENQFDKIKWNSERTAKLL